jgi:hypothetical protein
MVTNLSLEKISQAQRDIALWSTFSEGNMGLVMFQQGSSFPYYPGVSLSLKKKQV